MDEELSIKINKTVILAAVGLVLMFGAGYGLGRLGKATAKEANTNTVLSNTSGSDNGPEVSLTADDHIKGGSSAKVILVEYSDFQCPYCKKFWPVVEEVVSSYGNDVAWVYRHLPLTSIHQNAEIAALASECAGEQNKFWEYADKLFNKSQGDGTGLAETDLKKYAKDMKLDTSKFNSCLSSKKYASKVSADQSSGSGAGINGTPGTILIVPDGKTKLLSGALSSAQLKTAIDAALGK